MESKWVFLLDPYDDRAKETVEYLRKSLSPNYVLKVRGRGHREGPGSDHSIPLGKSERAVVYIFRKDDTVKDTGLPTADEFEKALAKEAASETGGSMTKIMERLAAKEK